MFKSVSLNGCGIKIWHEELLSDKEDYLSYWHCLSKEEKNIAGRFIHDLNLRRYVICHGKTRKILSDILGVSPEKIEFIKNEHGKPFIHVNNKQVDIEFNLSHSQDRMLLGVCNKAIGVDIEVIQESFDCGEVIELCLAPSEKQYYQSLPDDEKKMAFYKFWTRKESFLKATGYGLKINLSGIVTSTDGPPRLVSVPGHFGSINQWRLIELDFSLTACAAITISGKNSYD